MRIAVALTLAGMALTSLARCRRPEIEREVKIGLAVLNGWLLFSAGWLALQ